MVSFGIVVYTLPYMVIQYLGKQFFKIGFGDIVLAYNPVSKESKAGVKPARFGADIALISTNHPDFNGTNGLTLGEREPFVIDTPGEYEVRGIFVKGFLTQTTYDTKKYINTIYSVALEGMTLCFLGALASPEISPDIREAIGDVDVLFVPIAGGELLDASAAHKFSRTFNPKMIIPMDYTNEKSKEVKQFEEEAGEKGVKAVDKLTIKKKDIVDKEGEVVVLKPAS